MDRIIDAWLPLTFAVNSINRSMGQPDLYPFILPPPVIWKLTFVHDQIHAVSADRPSDSEHNAIARHHRGPQTRGGLAAIDDLIEMPAGARFLLESRQARKLHRKIA